jgi:hypothetical protein
MKKTYIILLQNNYLLLLSKKPKKKGNYLTGVRLFETSESTSAKDMCEWTENKFKSASIKEVENWE